MEAAVWIALARLALLVLPFARILRAGGRLQAPHASAQLCAADQRTAAAIGWAVERTADALPFRAVCLPRALAAAHMLRLRGLPSRLHFGAARRDISGKMPTHAWLDAGGVEVTGYPAAHDFVELGSCTYARRAPRSATSAEFRFVAACIARPLDADRKRRIEDAAQSIAHWPLVLAVAERQRVVALVYQACHGAGISIPPGTATRFAGAAKAATGQAILLALEAGLLQRLFAESGLSAVFLKGSALAVLACGEIGLRHSKDIDVLIEPVQYETVAAHLHSAGYVPSFAHTPPPPQDQSGWLHQGKSIEWHHPAKNIELEVHWKLTDLPLLTSMPTMPAVQVVSVLPGTSLRTLRSDALLIYLCAHGAAHAWSRLKWLADIYALLPSSEPLAIERLYRNSVSCDIGRAFGQALLLCHEILGLELPGALLTDLRRDRLLRVATYLAKTTLTRGGGAVELYDLPFGTTIVYLSRFLLGYSLQFVRAEARNGLTQGQPFTPDTRKQHSMPLTIILRLGKWIQARYRHRGRSHSEWRHTDNNLERHR